MSSVSGEFHSDQQEDHGLEVERDPVRQAEVAGRSQNRCAGVLALALTLTLTLPLVQGDAPIRAQELAFAPFVEEDAGTTEDLFDAAVSEDGNQIVIVGKNGTLLRRTDDARGGSYESLGAFAGSHFSGHLYDVAASPYDAGAGQVWVISGDAKVIETDFTNTSTVVGFGAAHLPVLPLAAGVYNGEFGSVPFDRVWWWHRDSQTGQSWNAPGGAIMALCDPGDGLPLSISMNGDIVNVVTSVYVHDQDDLAPLEVTAASFSDDCSFALIGVDTGPDAAELMVFDLDAELRGPATGWESVLSQPESFTLVAILVAPRDTLSPRLAICLGRKWAASRRRAAKSVNAFECGSVDYLIPPVSPLEFKPSVTVASDRLEGPILGVVKRPIPLARGGSLPELEVFAVGGGGKVFRSMLLDSQIFSDGFESGTADAW